MSIDPNKAKILLQMAKAIGGDHPAVHVTLGPGAIDAFKELEDALAAKKEAVMDPAEYAKGVAAMQDIMSKDVAELAAKEPNAKLDGYQPLLVRGRRFLIPPHRNPNRLSQVTGALFFALENPMVDAILSQLGSSIGVVQPDGSIIMEPLVPPSGSAPKKQPDPDEHLGRNILVGEVQEWPGAMLALLDPAGHPMSLGAPTSRNEDGTINIRLTGNHFMSGIPEDQVRWITTPEEALIVLETLAKPAGE